jgi:hypothetical protein
MGYNVIWLGEAQSVWKCPVEDVIDFSRDPMSRNLDITLGIIAKLKFTIQFWTASTRLSSMVGTPYILFESPEQIYGRGQEGFRRKLCDFGSSKLVVAHYKDIYENNQKGLDLSKQAIEEVCLGNFDDIFASGTMLSQHMRQEFEKRVNK